MSKKFMRIKRVTIPVISLVIMMSSLVGCSVVSDRELRYPKKTDNLVPKIIALFHDKSTP